MIRAGARSDILVHLNYDLRKLAPYLYFSMLPQSNKSLEPAKSVLVVQVICHTLYKYICQILFLGMYWIQLSIYLLNKMATTAALTILCVVTNEIFPTTVRQSVFNFCTMIGSVGSTVAVQIPLLVSTSISKMSSVF